MRLLLDTHTLFWALFEPAKLGSGLMKALEADADLWFSPVSLFEIETKARVGKWPTALPVEWRPHIDLLGAAELQVTLGHGVAAGRLPGPHKDPWDRLLIAQAQAEALQVVTLDPIFAEYGVPTLW